jgi:hypothetical protein
MKQLFTSTRLFLFTILLGSTFSHAVGQTSATIDYRFYTTKAHPFMIPDLPSGSTFTLIVKTGHPVYVAITGMDKGSGNYYLDGNGTPRNIASDTILTEVGDAGTGLINFKTNNVAKTLGLWINYQADLQDQTIGSATYGDYPDFIWVPQGGSAKVSAGKFMAAYGWKNLITNVLTPTSTIDSVMTLNSSIFANKGSDGSGLAKTWSLDTISILEKPTFNPTAKTLNFPYTVTGITYKLLKVGLITGNDTTWTETQNFVGDGNIKNITLTDGKYKLTTTFGIHTAVYPYGYFVVGVTTALDKTKEENINYRLIDNKLQFDNEMNFKFYSLQGQLLQQEQGSSFKLCRQAGIFKATDKNGNVLTAKIILK